MENDLLLASSALCISATTEYSRNIAYERIVLNIICSGFGSESFTEKDIESVVEKNGLRSDEVGNAISSLVKAKILVEIEDTFLLETSHRHLLEKNSEDIQKAIDITVTSITGQDKSNLDFEKYEKAILKSLIKITSTYGYLLADKITGTKRSKIQIIDYEEFEKTCKNALMEENIEKLDPKVMAQDIIHLLKTGDEKINRIMFNLVQNYYTLRLLGASLPIDFFSKEAFGDSNIFLDTNLLFRLMLPKDIYYDNVLEALFIAKELNSIPMVSESTLEELKNSFQVIVEIFLETANEIPLEMRSEIEDPMFLEYIEALESAITLEEFVEKYEEKRKILEEYNITFYDVPETELWEWSEDAQSRAEKVVFDVYYEIRGREKKEETTSHDAHMFFLIRHIRNEEKDSSAAWFVTQDYSLADVGTILQKEGEIPFSITLDEFLHTVSPFIRRSDDRKTFEDIYSQLIINKILPTENVFELADFKIFTDFDFHSKNMPAPIIRQTIRHIQSTVLKGGGLTRENRVQVAHEMARLFADPEKHFAEFAEQYKKEIQEYQAQMVKLKAEIEQTRTELEEKRSFDLKMAELKHNEDMGDLREEMTSKLEEHRNDIHQLRDDLTETKTILGQKDKELKEEKGKKETWKKRFNITLTVLIALGISTIIWIIPYLGLEINQLTQLILQICVIVGGISAIAPQRVLLIISIIVGIITSFAQLFVM